MARPASLIRTKQLNRRINADLKDRFEKHCNDNQKDGTKVLEKLIEDYLNSEKTTL